MADSNDFLGSLHSVIAANLQNDQFGVTELADLMNMSRSNLLRKVKKETNLSVNQLIREARLNKAMELLRATDLNISEIGDRVGFSSTSYFIKCFREHYGYPPGEAFKKAENSFHDQELVTNPVDESSPAFAPTKRSTFKNRWLVWSILPVCLIVVLIVYLNNDSAGQGEHSEKSIAVLPFKNESIDSTNVYLINGLMEATLNNLQKLRNLRVVSRTSSEKYRNTQKSIPEMAKELNVSYFVEGSGQKIGDNIVLNIQLIDAITDRHLWSKQYRRETKEIFILQQEIAENIAEEIKVIVSPAERRDLEKQPTENLEAYDCFLQGRDLFTKGGQENLKKAIALYTKAIEKDKSFSLAHADLAMVYYYLDLFQTEKKYELEINTYADKALLLDSKSPNSLVAKAMYYMHRKEYKEAVPYLEKALEYNPYSYLVISSLSDVYNNYIPNTEKYLQYALMGIRLNEAESDSTTMSYSYLHLSNALMQAGFIDEALKYVDISLTYKPDNSFSKWVKAFIVYARDRDLAKTKAELESYLNQDSMTNFILQEELGKVCYMMRDYPCAREYYEEFFDYRDASQLDIFKHESLKFAFVYKQLGDLQKAEQFEQVFKDYIDKDKSIYRSLNIAGYYAYKGEKEKALTHMQSFVKEDNVQYWVLLLRHDPLVDEVRQDPRFQKLMGEIEKRFWQNHDRIRKTLENKGLI